MPWSPESRRRFSPGQPPPRDDDYCPIARAMLRRHYLGTQEIDLSEDQIAGFGVHMLDCLKCQQYYVMLKAERDEREKER